MPAVDGIVSGLDTTALIDGIIGVARIPQVTMESQQAEYEDNLEDIAKMSGNLESLAETIEKLNTTADFNAFTAVAASEDQFSVTATTNAAAGTYQIQTLALASAETEISDGFADKDTPGVIAPGSIDIDYGVDSFSVTVDASDTLEDVASKINELAGITSYVLDTGEPVNPYKLVIQGDDTGAANTLDVTSSVTFTEVSSAKDAHIQVNSIDLYNDTNEFNSVIPGLDIKALDEGAGPVQVTVSQDSEAIEALVQDFVDSYNEVIKHYNTQTVFNLEEDIKGGLVGDSTARRTIDRIGTLVSTDYPGLVDGVFDTFSLAEMGIETNQDGTLSLDTEQFQTAIDDNYDLVLAAFTGQHQVSSTFSDPSDLVGAGTLNVTADGRAFDVTIDATDTLDDVADKLDALVGVDAKIVDQGGSFAIYVTSVATGSIEDVSIGSDIAGFEFNAQGGAMQALLTEINDVFVDSENGSLSVRSESLEATIEDYDDRIADFEDRMVAYEERLRAQFVALESILGELQSTSSQLSAILAGVNSSSSSSGGLF